MPSSGSRAIRPLGSASAWRFYERYYRGSYRVLLLTVLASMGQSLLLFPLALLVRHAVDNLIPRHDLGRLMLIGLAILLLYLASSGLSLWTRAAILRLTKRAILRLREDLVEKLYSVSRAYFNHADLGGLHTTIVQDTERLDVMSNALVAQVLPALVTCLVLAPVLLILNWLLFLVLFAAAPAAAWVSRLLGRRMRGRTRAFRAAFEDFSKGILFLVRNLDLTRMQAAEDFELDRQRVQLDRLRRTSGSMAWLQSATDAAHSAILATAGVLILVIGGIAVATGHLSTGGLLAFYIVTALLKDAANTVLIAVPQIIAGNEALTALHDVWSLHAPPPYAGRRRIHFTGRVSLEDVYFRYDEAPVLRGLTLALEPGSTVAILGANGAGKSTILQLILGFYRPQHGRLLADGLPFDDLDLVELRRRIGTVPQDPVIFPGTIAENIAYGWPEAPADAIQRVAEAASASAFIARLPKGFDSLAGEEGALLSGGQRQRLAIARALLRQPALLLLDEPGNHLDQAALGCLLQGLRDQRTPPATLIISHDMEVARACDIVFRLENGRLTTHDGVVGTSVAAAPPRGLPRREMRP